MWGILVRLVPVYVGGGVVAGGIVGILLPLAKRRIGAAAVGVVAAMPIGFAIIRLSDASFESWTSDQVVPAVLGSVLLGGIAGWQAWEWGRIPL